MEHKSQIRIVPEADTAVLFIHGISGSIRHFRDVIPLTDLVPDQWSIYNLLLPGHGGTVKDFGNSGMKLWRSAAEEAFLDLAKSHRRVVLVAHSMGTLFSLQLAAKYPEKIGALFLLAVPLRVWMSLGGAIRVLRLAFGRSRTDNPWDMALVHACGVEPTWKLWQYLGWIPRFLELFREIHRTGKILRCLSAPAVVFQSRRDEMVLHRSGRILEQCGCADVTTLPESGHFYYAPRDRERVLQSFRIWIGTLKKHD